MYETLERGIEMSELFVCNWYDTDCHLEYDGFTSVDKDKSIIQQLLEYVKGD